YACEKTNILPQQCIYVGDAERDIQAGNVVGMRTIAALFGYIQDHDIPSEWQADAMIEHPNEFWQHFEQWN
ncbi:MAG: HAD hydrolase-like protein, partial [Gammaproteobacteria bacterium]|nr:HAD hydrolase-like protein [Gammaproteobacteria bacterium]